MQDRPSTEKTRFQGAVGAARGNRFSPIVARACCSASISAWANGERCASTRLRPLHNDAIDDDDGPHGHLVGGGRFGSKF